MTKSRRLPALILLILVVPAPAAAQTSLPEETAPLPEPGTAESPTIVTADEAIAMGRAQIRDMISIDCPPGRAGEEVVVCGRRQNPSRYRLPLARAELGRGTGVRAGDAQLHAMEANDQRCTPIGRDNGCGDGIDVIGIGFAIVRGIAQALANRD